ncbi:NYN domain-containing protein [Trichocoleus sp. DQ-U1]|uniref:NYN domain-containing protein n=1 Tax=Trichocoleus sp. DQ-U1 TaxID=2933926 RepID=UPI0032985BF2
MPDNVRVTSVNDSTVIKEISFCIYQTIIFVQQQQPKLLTEKYRNVPWSDALYQSSFLLKLQTEFNKAPDRDTLIKTVQKLLRLILTPQCLELPISSKLIEKLRILIDSASEIAPRNGSGFSPPPEAPRVLIPEQHIAILLLDAENLQLDTETEKFLAAVCTYPIQIKIAFANWRNMGKQDAELHGRGYELIHVPAGKDSADVKMATVGSSIFVHYPTAKEVFVCSSDKVMTHLCTTLQTHGLTVYLVCKQGENITVLNSKTGHSQTRSLKPNSEIPSLDQCIIQLKQLIKAEKEGAANSWIKLSRLSQLFHTTYNITISQVVSAHTPGKRARDIFLERPSEFVVHQPQDQAELYVTIFDMNQENNLMVKTFEKEIESKTQKPSSFSKITSKIELEKALVIIINDLTAHSPGSYIGIPSVGSEFHKRYKQPITKVLKDLQLGSKFPVFLKSNNTFKLKKAANTYQVAIAQKS